MQIGWGKRAPISRTRREIGKRVIYNGGTKPRMPEKSGFIGAIWDFRSGSRSSGVHPGVI
jgi:hypothetical protein